MFSLATTEAITLATPVTSTDISTDVTPASVALELALTFVAPKTDADIVLILVAELDSVIAIFSEAKTVLVMV